MPAFVAVGDSAAASLRLLARHASAKQKDHLPDSVDFAPFDDFQRNPTSRERARMHAKLHVPD